MLLRVVESLRRLILEIRDLLRCLRDGLLGLFRNGVDRVVDFFFGLGDCLADLFLGLVNSLLHLVRDLASGCRGHLAHVRSRIYQCSGGV